MFLELRSIKKAAVPFISAAPVGDSLNKILASIEGPPDTPYEAGIFWINVKMSDCHPSEPPILRFQTRIFHPNIDCHGNICADYRVWWSDPNLRCYMKTIGSDNAPWFSERTSNPYSLGALLTALCGLLASPNVEDPLVPEIAQMYITNYKEYCETARLYTEKYAGGTKPPDDSIVFEENHNTPDEQDYPRLKQINGRNPPSPQGSVGGSSLRISERIFYEQEAEGERMSLHSHLQDSESTWIGDGTPSQPSEISNQWETVAAGKTDGGTTLLWAAATGREAAVLQLLDGGADVNAEDDQYGGTALHWAARCGYQKIVQLLLENGAETEARDMEDGETPLHWAARAGHKTIIRLLLEKGADIEALDPKSGGTALHWAIRTGHKTVVRLLLSKGANLKAGNDQYGGTALHWAAYGGHKKIVQLLLEKGAEIEARDKKDGETPLHWAASAGREMVVQLLVNKGANIKTKNYGMKTALDCAAKAGHEAVVQLLEKAAKSSVRRDIVGVRKSKIFPSILRHRAKAVSN